MTEPRKRSFVQIFEIVWSRPWTVVIFILAAALIAGIYTNKVRMDRIIDLLQQGLQ